MEILTIYVIYSVGKDPFGTVERWMLVNKSSFDFSTRMAEEFGRVVALVHNDTVIETDPIIELAIVTDERLPAEVIPEINQACINWLVNEGYGKPKKGGKGIDWNFKKLKREMQRED